MRVNNMPAFCAAVEAMVNNGTPALDAMTLISKWVMEDRAPTPDEMALPSAAPKPVEDAKAPEKT